MADQFGAPGELNRALADGNMTISGVGAMDAGQCQAQLGGLKTINQRGFAEGTGKKKALLVGWVDRADRGSSECEPVSEGHIAQRNTA